jgi:hypothetical protein
MKSIQTSRFWQLREILSGASRRAQCFVSYDTNSRRPVQGGKLGVCDCSLFCSHSLPRLIIGYKWVATMVTYTNPLSIGDQMRI